jgi:predicted transcriptional regulator
MKKLTISVDDEILELLAELAKVTKASRSQVVRRLVLEESKRNKKVD